MKHRPSSRPAETTAKTPTKTAVKAPTEPLGLGVRRVAADIVDGVLRRHRPLDEQLEGASAHPGLAGLADRDRALVRALVAVVLRSISPSASCRPTATACTLPAWSTRYCAGSRAKAPRAWPNSTWPRST